MSLIIPPPIKIEFPEQITLSNQISGTRTDVAATEQAVKKVNDKVNQTNKTLSDLTQAVNALAQTLEDKPKILSGTNEPDSSLGRDGDIYFLTD